MLQAHIVQPLLLSSTVPLLRLHIDLGASRGLVALGSDDLVVMLTQVETVTSPGVEVVLHVHTSTDALLCANRPELVVSIYVYHS